MSKVQIDSELALLVAKLSELRIATPINNRNYKKITKQYREASERQTAAIDKAIDDSDQNYLEFSKEIKTAIESLNAALESIKKVANAIEQVAKVLDILGKIFAAVATVA